MANEGMPYLIQRVSRRDQVNESQKGFDRIFSLDYMGSSEFEFGTIPQALKAMRANKVVVPDKPSESWRVRPIMAEGVTCYYVGSPETFNIAVQLFEDEMKPDFQSRKFRHKEWTYIRETYFPEKGRTRLGPYHAWWALDGLMPFFLFKEKKHAEELFALL